MGALVLAVVLGLQGLGNGCGSTLILREGTMPDLATVVAQAEETDPIQVLFRVSEAAYLRSIAEHARVTFPLGVGRMLLGGLLCVAGFLALGGRRGSRALLLQAVAANVLFVALDYALTREVRASWIGMMAEAVALLPGGLAEQERTTMADPMLWWMVQRIRFVLFGLGPLALIALAITRARARLWFQAMAAATRDDTEEP